MVAGFETPTSGRLMLDGHDLAGVPPYRRPTNMMFQSYALFPHMTVEANVAFGLKQESMPKDQIAARVDEMLKMVKLSPFAKRRPHQLSGGQRQRVALARSLAKKPKVLLLDEPLGALDKKLREETQFELTNLQVDLGLTFLIVTHDQEEAMTLADRIAVMNQGKIIQIGTPAEIYEQPNSRYVAEGHDCLDGWRRRPAGLRRHWRDGCGYAGGFGQRRRQRLVRDPAGEGVGVVGEARRRQRQRARRRGQRHRLPRRHFRLSRQTADRRHDEGDAHQPHAHGRTADHVERQGLADLDAGFRRYPHPIAGSRMRKPGGPAAGPRGV